MESVTLVQIYEAGVSGGVKLGDFIQLRNLEENMLLVLTDGVNNFNLIIGAGTPYSAPSTNSDNGWHWYENNKAFIVINAYRIQPTNGHNILTTESFKQIIKAANSEQIK